MGNNNFDPYTGEPISGSSSGQTPPHYQSGSQASQGAYVPPQSAAPNANYQQQGYNTQNPYAVPPEVHKWNWGAFMYNWIWGIGNRAYLTLLCFVPLLGFIWMFVCGAKGNQWAWESGHFKDLETFRTTQETWSRAGFVAFIIALFGVVISIIALIILIAIFGSISSWIYYFDYRY